MELLLENDVNSKRVGIFIENLDFVFSAGIHSKLQERILSKPKNGIINFHYSLLPKYRGTHPVFWQKVYRDNCFGYSFHLMRRIIDKGEIVLQKEVLISSDKTVAEISDQLTLHAANQLFYMIYRPIQLEVQNHLNANKFTEQDYLNYIRIDFLDPGEVWNSKCKSGSYFILNDTYLVSIFDKCKRQTLHNELKIEKTSLILWKDGFRFEFKKVNYLPAILYYYKFKKLVG